MNASKVEIEFAGGMEMWSVVTAARAWNPGPMGEVRTESPHSEMTKEGEYVLAQQQTNVQSLTSPLY